MADQPYGENNPGTGKLFEGTSTHPDAAHWRGFVIAHRDIRAGEKLQLSVWDKGAAARTGIHHMDVKMDDGATGLGRAVYGDPQDRPPPRPARRPDFRPAPGPAPGPAQGAGPAPARPAPRPAPARPAAPVPPADDDVPW